MTQKLFLAQPVERAWDIEGYPDYFFGSDNQLYRFDKQGRLHRNKRTVIGYTQGYVLKSKFISLTKLRSLLCRHEPTNHPTSFDRTAHAGVLTVIG